jgi:hypothetical protein
LFFFDAADENAETQLKKLGNEKCHIRVFDNIRLGDSLGHDGVM